MPSGSSPTPACQSRGMPSGPPQACVKSASAQRREQVAGRRAQAREHPRVAVERGRDPRTPVVGRAAAAEHQPVVGRALAVDDQVAVVGERLTAREPGGVPERRRAAAASRRSASTPAPPSAARAGPTRPPWPARPTRAVTTPRSVTIRRGPTAVAGRALDDRHAPPLDGPREPAHEPGGLDPRAVRRVRRPAAPGWRRPAPTPAAPRRGTRPRHGPAAAATGVRARATVPPFTQSQAMPSAATALPTSSTVSRIAAPMASAAARPWRRASAAWLAGNSAEHHPPLRPLAPNPRSAARRRPRAGPGRRAAGGRRSRGR